MVSDRKRVFPFRRAILKTCNGKRVLESGTGSGILSILAAKAGAKMVYAVEKDKSIARFAKVNIEKSGFRDRIKLLTKDVRDITVHDLDGEKADVAIAENLSTWQVTEPQIPILNHVNQYLIKKRGIRLPEMIFNYAELAQSRYRFEDLVELRTHYFGFTGIQKSRLLSSKQLCSTVDLRYRQSLRVQNTVSIPVVQKGILNSVRLTSPIRIYEGIFFDSSDSLMPPVIAPLKNDIPVSKGDTIELKIRYTYNSDWDHVSCRARIVRFFSHATRERSSQQSSIQE